MSVALDFINDNSNDCNFLSELHFHCAAALVQAQLLFRAKLSHLQTGSLSPTVSHIANTATFRPYTCVPGLPSTHRKNNVVVNALPLTLCDEVQQA